MIKYNKLGKICGKYKKVLLPFRLQVIWYRAGENDLVENWEKSY